MPHQIAVGSNLIFEFGNELLYSSSDGVLPLNIILLAVLIPVFFVLLCSVAWILAAVFAYRKRRQKNVPLEITSPTTLKSQRLVLFLADVIKNHNMIFYAEATKILGLYF